jgi:hypothetical protein
MNTNVRRRIEGLEARSVAAVGVIPKAVRDVAVSAELQRLRAQTLGLPLSSSAFQPDEFTSRVIAAALRADR